MYKKVQSQRTETTANPLRCKGFRVFTLNSRGIIEDIAETPAPQGIQDYNLSACTTVVPHPYFTCPSAVLENKKTPVSFYAHRGIFLLLLGLLAHLLQLGRDHLFVVPPDRFADTEVFE